MTTTPTTMGDKMRSLKSPCIICGKMAGVFSCRGCSENFCLRHTSIHREQLQTTMDEILHHHEQFRRNLQGQNLEQNQENLLEQINRWEEQSLEKIRRLAEETRQQLVRIVREQNVSLNEHLAQLKEQIDRARQDGGFYENDLKSWSNRLQQLQRNFTEQQTIQIDERTGASPFIPRIFLHDRVRVNSSPYEDYSPRKDKDVYSSGKHLVRFKIEDYQRNTSIILGIISRTHANISNPYRNPTFYGWTEKNLVYRAGVIEENFRGYMSDFRNNDALLLMIDCQQERINLTNTRTNHSYDLDVDVRKCPLPWELNVHLFNDTQ